MMNEQIKLLHEQAIKQRNDAREMYQLEKSDFVVIATRKAMELMVRGLCSNAGINTISDGKSRELASLIDELKENGIISAEEAKLLNHLRFLGNKGAHTDNMPSMDEALNAINTLESIITLIFDNDRFTIKDLTAEYTDSPMIDPDYFDHKRKYRGKWARFSLNDQELLMDPEYVALKRRADSGDVNAMLSIACGFLPHKIVIDGPKVLIQDEGGHKNNIAEYDYWALLAAKTASEKYANGELFSRKYIATELYRILKSNSNSEDLIRNECYYRMSVLLTSLLNEFGKNIIAPVFQVSDTDAEIIKYLPRYYSELSNLIDTPTNQAIEIINQLGQSIDNIAERNFVTGLLLRYKRLHFIYSDEELAEQRQRKIDEKQKRAEQRQREIDEKQKLNEQLKIQEEERIRAEEKRRKTEEERKEAEKQKETRRIRILKIRKRVVFICIVIALFSIPHIHEKREQQELLKQQEELRQAQLEQEEIYASYESIDLLYPYENNIVVRGHNGCGCLYCLDGEKFPEAGEVIYENDDFVLVFAGKSTLFGNPVYKLISNNEVIATDTINFSSDIDGNLHSIQDLQSNCTVSISMSRDGELGTALAEFGYKIYPDEVTINTGVLPEIISNENEITEDVLQSIQTTINSRIDDDGYSKASYKIKGVYVAKAKPQTVTDDTFILVVIYDKTYSDNLHPTPNTSERIVEYEHPYIEKDGTFSWCDEITVNPYKLDEDGIAGYINRFGDDYDVLTIKEW